MLSHGPVTDVSLLDIRCGKDASTAFAPAILSVAAGQTLGFAVDPDIQHPGPGMAYLAKVPAGKTAATWDGSGAVWFKVWEQGAGFAADGTMTWATTGMYYYYARGKSALLMFVGLKTLSFKIPAATPSGDYLTRIEHIGLHAASQTNGAQFYLSCGQITVTNGGTGSPAPLVAFPGAYKATDPGVLIQIYYPLVRCRVITFRGVDANKSTIAQKLYDSWAAGLDRIKSPTFFGQGGQIVLSYLLK